MDQEDLWANWSRDQERICAEFAVCALWLKDAADSNGKHSGLGNEPTSSWSILSLPHPALWPVGADT